MDFQKGWLIEPDRIGQGDRYVNPKFPSRQLFGQISQKPLVFTCSKDEKVLH